MHSVYQIEVDGKKYIGCTGEPITVRIAKHRYDARYNKLPIHKALNRAGLFNAVVTVLARFSDRKRALATEKRLIRESRPALNVYLK